MSREQQIRDAVDRFLARVRQDTDARLQTLASDLLRIVEGRGADQPRRVERAAIEMARAVARGGEHARHDLIARVVGAVRRLDGATTLRGILDALADGAAAESVARGRAARRRCELRSYRHHGFGPGLAPPDIAIDGGARWWPGVIESARRPRCSRRVISADARLPAFMRVPAGHVGQVIPLVVRREVVAVVYVEGADASAGRSRANRSGPSRSKCWCATRPPGSRA